MLRHDQDKKKQKYLLKCYLNRAIDTMSKNKNSGKCKSNMECISVHEKKYNKINNQM